MESHPEAEVGGAEVRLQDYLASGHVRVARLTYFRLWFPQNNIRKAGSFLLKLRLWFSGRVVASPRILMCHYYDNIQRKIPITYLYPTLKHKGLKWKVIRENNR